MNPNNINETASNEDGYRNVSLIKRKISMATLILWNISKALEKNPVVEIKSAMKAVQARLENNSRNLNTIGSQYPEERYLACALLAWQELGHKDTDSLYRFIEANRSKCESIPSNIQNKYKHCSTKVANTAKTSITTKVSNYSEGVTSGNFDTCSLIGPVIKLPVETKIVMRLENTPNVLRQEKKKRRQDKDTMKKIDAACCMDSACVERLSELDAATSELRMRAGQLASREAKRVELLERAETAWKDLELGYQRRLILAEEKEEDMAKQIHKLIEERNSYKHVCTTLSSHLKERGEAAEKDRMRLIQIEKDVCDRACQRLRLTEESARGDAIVAEHQCKAAQLDRNLQEQQARRKLSNVENEVESARALTYEAERAMRSELAALRDQIEQVSHQLLKEDAENSQTKQELEVLRQEKLEMVEDLEGCKVMCDSHMQDKVTELKKKREQLSQLRDKVTECQCKMPIDATVEAKRTPSLAASCKCTPEDKLLESCSCTSLRSRLLSNLLADLFGGLQAELGGSGSQMPCHLLKCLEDKHNWDRSSAVKTNLRNYFTQLLIGELDIAIATSIENYHAKWVGASCADVARLTPDPGEIENEGWQERALKRKAQKLATKLAEQMFQERAEQLAQQAKNIVSSGPPPCECKPQSAVYSCFVKPAAIVGDNSKAAGPSTTAPAYWRKTSQDVTQLRMQIEDLKRETIKKADLKLMENNIAKIVQLASVLETSTVATKIIGSTNADSISKYDINYSTPTAIKKNQLHYFTGDTFNKQRGDFYKNVDKGIDSQSFKGTIVDKHEMCVCCNKNNFDESRDLELNTFHLLKEHLKDRLEEFRQSACKSSCISSDEQEKIFSTIFQRVKQVISDSTNNIICKCAEDEYSSSSSQGSWNRAYILLQEYLNTKIKRVQCFCVPLQANEKSVLPNVLDRICNLIENDFDRVKKLCKCRNIVNKNEENRFEIQNDLPERDINNELDTPIGIGINQPNNTKITSPAITTQNISAQVPNNLGMETKSCDIMERGLKNIQTTESCVLLANNYCNSSDLCISCNLNKNKTKLYSELRTTNEMLNMENNIKSNSKYKTYNDGTQKKRSKPNIISRIFIWWMCPVLIKGNKRDVEESDLIVPNKQYDSDRHGDRLERYWLEELKRAKRENREPSLWKALQRAYWLAYMPGAIFVGLLGVSRTVQPLLFGRLLMYWTDPDMSRQEAGFYALGMLASNFVSMMCQHHNNLFVMRFSLKVKIACSALLYRKVLRMSQVALGEVAGGKLVNLLSNDLIRFDYALMFVHYIWLIPIQTGVVLYLLYETAGYAPFVGLFTVIILIFPIQAGLTKLTTKIRRQTAQRTDRRIKLMNEIINGIQVIKMYAWEKPFQKVVEMTRTHETRALTKAIFVRSVFIGFMLFTDRTIMFLTILTLVLGGEMISASTIYPIQQYFSIIQFNITMILPMLIASLSEMKVSVERIQGFMIMDERDDTNTPTKDETNGTYNNNIVFNQQTQSADKNNVAANKFENVSTLQRTGRQHKLEDTSIDISDVSACWLNEAPDDECTLTDISINIRKGELCAVIGPVGTGKTSLLQLLLKEMPLRSGTVTVNGSVSYSCQESWLFAGTVRENITFGLTYDPEKYKEVCQVCSLLPDFKQFPYGDLSLVGDRGVSLSGGQRARINLARAVYRDADIYLLDDPLSAVDANVGRQLFEGCIKGYLRGKTVVLVTHQLHYLKAADYLVILNDGTIENMGTYDELVKSEKEFSFLLSSLQEGESDKEVENVSSDKSVKRVSMNRSVSIKSEKDNPNAEKEQKLAAEERASGNLKWEVVSSYLKSVDSWFMVFLAMVTLTITQATATTVDYWISFWTNNVDDYIQNLPEGVKPDPGLDSQIGPLMNWQYILVHGCVILALILFAHIRIATFVSVTMRASRNLHNMVFNKLIITVMRFFDTNPSGRILNRFSKDVGALDELLPRSILETLQMYFSMTSVLILNAVALPWTLIPTAVLVVVFVLLLRWYLKAAQAVKRLEGTTKSPVFGMINSTLSGLVTIRSSNSQHRLQKQFDDAQDLHSSAFFTYIGGSSAFGLYLDGICLAYLGLVLCIFILIEFDETVIPVGSVGLAVTQSMTLTMLLQMAARFTADFLGQMTSVERVLEYTELPCEQNMEVGPTVPPNNWPSKGEVKFENVFMKYGPEDPPVLKDLNFVIKEGWKVGVVGRTGAGKSSLISALFRLCDIDGSIKIDGIDTRDLAKKQLRSKISIIPQEPVLFSATMRYNLDPFENYSDDEIWKALELVELKEAVQALDQKVSEGGSNFSMGQRQLICLARAVLRSNKVLVMDEATANVDPQTDALIQKTIRNVFTSCTVITIAHRLNTIMDSDRVLVMDKGHAVEFDYPYILLSNPNSTFNLMVKETTESMSKVLYEIAKMKYDSDNHKE
ncbi:ATP-binding cassette sub-family C member 4-like [Achroia grisella]|uniref:ATP-binding cassette sub-family C member 4-like n=1 Tax=Achroia grisella TaxID=688607 RepID=UPI0027D2E01F|nr:ATP-binding cassette sub-family C member 4-like [Achroia grisella]